MKAIRIDRTKPLAEEPHTGHNRWHPDIPAILEIEDGETVLFETRDAIDGYYGPDSTEVDFGARPAGTVHPLTGPVLVKGARPGDLLEAEFLDISTENWGYSAIVPGMGFLRELFTEPFLVHWHVADGFATSPQIPGVRIPEGAFMGISGVAPSHAQLDAWTRREQAVVDAGHIALMPEPNGAVPAVESIASRGLRTMPPRENGGNFDVRQLTKGARLYLPVAVDGALFSTGDAHFAQGDGEVCVTGIEIGATCVVRFKIHKGEAERRRVRFPRFARSDYFVAPEWAAPERFVATMGMPIDDAGVVHPENLTLAAQNALIAMIDELETTRGLTRPQAYVLCSVAMDLRIGNAVDVPNYTVTAILSEDVFAG